MKSLAHQFLDFCRSKPADEAFVFGDANICAVAQFGRNCDRPDLIGRVLAPAIIGDNNAMVTRAIWAVPHTFGALADRLEAALSAGAPA